MNPETFICHSHKSTFNSAKSVYGSNRVYGVHFHRKLSLSTNAIEKITNLNGLSVSISLCVCFTNWIIF
jgi:hypothetical protein